MLDPNINKRVRVRILSDDSAELNGTVLEIHNRSNKRKLKPAGATTHMQLRFSIFNDQYYLVFADMGCN